MPPKGIAHAAGCGGPYREKIPRGDRPERPAASRGGERRASSNESSAEMKKLRKTNDALALRVQDVRRSIGEVPFAGEVIGVGVQIVEVDRVLANAPQLE